MSTMTIPANDQLSEPDQVLVALLGKNTSIGEGTLARVVADWLRRPVNGRSDLAHHFVEIGQLTRTEMFRLVKARNFALLRKEDKRVARRAVRKGYITRTRINEALDFQKQLFKALGDIKRLHEILVDDGSLTRTQVTEIWDEYRTFLARRGERPAEARTDPNLMKRQG